MDDNQYVQKGAVLVEIDPKDYEIAVAQAQADLASAEATAQSLNITVPITSVSTSSQLRFTTSDVETSNAGIIAADRQLTAAHAQVEQAEANDVRAQDDLRRYKALVDKREVAEQIYDQALAAAKASTASVSAAHANEAAAQQSVKQSRSRLTQAQAIDGLALAETTPGPLIMVVQFVGFMAAFRDAGGLPPMLAATLGGLLATWVTFAPCFLWIFAGAPYIETMRGNKALAGALSAITAAVVGVILNLSIWFALHTLFRQTFDVKGFGLAFEAPALSSVDVPALVLALAAATAIFRFKVGMLTVLASSCVAGILLRLTGII